MRLICLLFVGVVLVATSAAVVKLAPARAEFLSKAEKTCLSADQHEVCRQNGVSMAERKNEDGTWSRSLRFGDECATETTVVCKNPEPCRKCGKCPCDIDAGAGLSVNYMQVMYEQLGPWCLKADSKVLMLGLGGGELVQYLLNQCPGMHIDAVELNGDVISMARTYFGVKESESTFKGRLDIEQADALVAVGERADVASESYDAVLVDCFSGGGEVPESCRSQELAQKVKDILKTGGALLQNIWHYSPKSERVHQDFLDTKSIYSNVFDGALDDLPVPMPASVRWVDILKATKKDIKTILSDLTKTMESARAGNAPPL